eukprot:SAG31_NODE_18986_length_615_cov_1.360465_1_plen_164_part_01
MLSHGAPIANSIILFSCIQRWTQEKSIIVLHVPQCYHTVRRLHGNPHAQTGTHMQNVRPTTAGSRQHDHHLTSRHHPTRRRHQAVRTVGATATGPTEELGRSANLPWRTVVAGIWLPDHPSPLQSAESGRQHAHIASGLHLHPRSRHLSRRANGIIEGTNSSAA